MPINERISVRPLTITTYDEALAKARADGDLENFLVTYLRREIQERSVGDKRLEDILTATMVEVQDQLHSIRDDLKIVDKLEAEQAGLRRSLDAYTQEMRILVEQHAKATLAAQAQEDRIEGRLDALNASLEKTAKTLQGNEVQDSKQDEQLKQIDKRVTALTAVKAGVAGGTVIAVWELLKHIF